MNSKMTCSTSNHLVSEQDELIKLVVVPASFVSHYHAGEKRMKYMDRISTPKPTDVLGSKPGGTWKILPFGWEVNNSLVVEPTHLKIMLFKMDHFPKFRGEHSKNI